MGNHQELSKQSLVVVHLLLKWEKFVYIVKQNPSQTSLINSTFSQRHAC
jgi:hypothetical protein